MTTEFDLIVQGGIMVDGSGLPRRRCDLGVKGGRIAHMGMLKDADAPTVLDADGMVVAPGLVDIHTHYDPQITFDPYASVSSFHGVTTVLAGNCGFSVAPCRAEDRDFMAGVFAAVENMDPAALGGVAWDECTTFPDFLASRTGKLGVNLACYLGHSNVRRWVMGPEASEREATAVEIDEMCRLVREAMAAGAAGLSSSASGTHLDINGIPVPSRPASREDFKTLVVEVGRHGRGSIAFLTASSAGGINEIDKEYLIELSLACGLPVIIQGLGGRNKVDPPTAWESSKEFLVRCSTEGAAVYSMCGTRPFDRSFTITPGNPYFPGVPSWDRVFRSSRDELVAALRDPAIREEMRYAVENPNTDPAKGSTVPAPQWQVVFVDRVFLPEHEKFQGRSVAAVAEELGCAPGDVVLDLALSEDLAPEFRWRTENETWATASGRAQVHPNMIVGTSDGGAHLAKDDGGDWTSNFLRSWVFERKLWTLEEGIRQLTHVPAALVGLHDRGLIKQGGWADLMIFDPDTIGPSTKEFVRDLPGGAGRFKSWGRGVHATVVNGTPIILEGQPTGALPGQVVSPG